MDMALAAHQALGCKGCSRSDFRWDDSKGVEGLYFLEVNTQPGMTPLSLVPEQARHCGISYEDLVGRILERSEEHTSELQSLMRISYAVFCLKKKKTKKNKTALQKAHKNT